MDPLFVFSEPTWLVIAGLFGAVFGSFANVVVYRLPAGRSIAQPGSHCGSCGTCIKAYDNIPVLSYLILQGRCRACGSRISYRYAVVELSMALLAVAVFRHTVLEAGTLEAATALNCLVSFAFCWTLLVVAFVDLDTQLIPTSLTDPMVVVGLAAHVLLPGGTPTTSAIGVIVGFGVPYGLSVFGRLFFGYDVLGLGDARLLAMIGAFLGWPGALFAFVAAAFQSLIAQAIIFASELGKKRTESEVPPWRRPFALGPFIVLGALELFVFQGWITPWLESNLWLP